MDSSGTELLTASKVNMTEPTPLSPDSSGTIGSAETSLMDFTGPHANFESSDDSSSSTTTDYDNSKNMLDGLLLIFEKRGPMQPLQDSYPSRSSNSTELPTTSAVTDNENSTVSLSDFKRLFGQKQQVPNPFRPLVVYSSSSDEDDDELCRHHVSVSKPSMSPPYLLNDAAAEEIQRSERLKTSTPEHTVSHFRPSSQLDMSVIQRVSRTTTLRSSSEGQAGESSRDGSNSFKSSDAIASSEDFDEYEQEPADFLESEEEGVEAENLAQSEHHCSMPAIVQSGNNPTRKKRKLECRFCPRRFKTTQAKYAHEQIHKPPPVCKYGRCAALPKSFTQVSSFRRHVRKEHHEIWMSQYVPAEKPKTHREIPPSSIQLRRLKCQNCDKPQSADFSVSYECCLGPCLGPNFKLVDRIS